MFDLDFLKRADDAAISEYLDGLARAYTPEWRADPARPDLGAALTQLFSRMLAGNITRVNRLPEKISSQLVDMLDIRPMPAQPARSVARFSAVGADSVFVPRGTKLSAKSEDGGTSAFETLHGLTVISAGIGRLIFSSGMQGKIYYGDGQNAITLYGQSQGTVPDAVLTLEHPYLFRFEDNNSLQITFDGISPENLEALADPNKFSWSFAGETGISCKAHAEKSARQNSLRLTAAASAETKHGGRFSVQCKAVKPVTEEISAARIYLGTSAEDIAPEQIWQDDILQEDGRIYPFGKRLSLLSELRIACDSVLTQKGAAVTMRFRLEYKKIRVDLPEEQKRQYKLLMKADPPIPPPQTVFAQEVSLECWNGTGWRPVKTNPPVRRIFVGEETGEIRLDFACPEDIEPIQLGAAERNWLRLRLLRANGCYLTNTVHLVPVISDIRFSYEYGQKSIRPSQVRILHEMRSIDVTAELQNNRQTGIFSQLSIEGDRLLIGLDAKPSGDAINVYFDIERAPGPFWLEAEYSSASGLRRLHKLHLDDYTDGLSRSDAIVFTAPQDFSELEIYGESLYWIILRLRPRGEHPVAELKIRGVYLNAVEVEGRYTGEAETFFNDDLIAENELRLSAKDLLYAEVWVDEAAGLGDFEKSKLREGNPQGVREERDLNGAPLHFWVRWDEVRDFRACTAKDRCYTLDRSSGIVRFSDGIRGRRLPAGEGGATGTIEVIPVSSTGARGNVPKHAITQPLEQLDFIGSVDNITEACGGCDAQTPASVLKYACSYVRSGGRIVTAEDLLDAVQFSCGEIAKLKLAYEGGFITLLFLPYDFENAARLFSRTEERIRKVLSQSWQDPPQNFRVRLPDFAEITVEAGVVSSGDAINEEEAVRRRLNEFLHPITGGFGRTGWEIGILPQREQILSAIRSVCPKAKVELPRITVYIRESGEYFNLRDKPDTRNMAAIPGRYNLTWRRKAESFTG